MDDGAVKTLFLPIETGDVDTGGSQAQWLFLNAAAPPHECVLGKTQIRAVQGFRPLYRALAAQGYSVMADVPEGVHDGALILISRHRAHSRRLVNQALARVQPGRPIILAGTKNDGIASLAKEIAGLTDLSGSFSKHHAKAIWFEARQGITLEDVVGTRVDNRYETSPGMFSSGHIDPGSAFLIDTLPHDMKGRIADFCAGWGYLSAEMAMRSPAIRSVALYEADHASLEAARRNMAALVPQVTASFHWQDLITESASGDYDTIIMNPPFHKGRAADPGIAAAMIRNAHKALHRGGKLYLVANRTLPYENVMGQLFFKTGELARNESYKVLWATK